jgi:hypothetical protein
MVRKQQIIRQAFRLLSFRSHGYAQRAEGSADPDSFFPINFSNRSFKRSSLFCSDDLSIRFA